MKFWLNQLKYIIIYSIMIVIFIAIVLGSFYNEFENKKYFWSLALFMYLIFMFLAFWEDKYGEEE